MQAPARERFAAMMSAADVEIDLVEAALLVAAEERAELDVDGLLERNTHRLDLIADTARGCLAVPSEPARVTKLVEFLHETCRFRGNQRDYYDVRNSYLDEVIERRLGIPITLAIVYMRVGRSVGLDIHGVGFPGHFLALWQGPPRIVIDPFHGALLSETDCAERLRAAAGPAARFDPGMLSPADGRQIIARVLGNLKLIHFRRQAYAAALACSERILLAQPDLPAELRDRALLYLKLECFEAAGRDFQRFLEVAGDHPEADAVRRQLNDLRAHGPRLH